MKIVRHFLTSIFTLLTLLSCTSNPCETGHLATLEDWTGFDGCGYIFILEDGSKLEPVQYQNLLPLVPGNQYCITFDTVPAASICMVGVTVEITSIKDL